MTELYHISRLSSAPDRSEFEVAKFVDGTQDNSYKVLVTPHHVSCECWGFVRHQKPCRHMQMVARWVLNGDKPPKGGNKP